MIFPGFTQVTQQIYIYFSPDSQVFATQQTVVSAHVLQTLILLQPKHCRQTFVTGYTIQTYRYTITLSVLYTHL